MPAKIPDHNHGLGTGKCPVISTKQLARLFNLTETRIAQLAQEGVLEKVSRGRYDLFKAVHSYVSYLQTRKVNQWDDDEPSDIKAEQLRRTKEQADELELKNAKTRGELVEVARVILWGQKQLSALKQEILNLDLDDEKKDKILRKLLAAKVEDADFIQ